MSNMSAESAPNLEARVTELGERVTWLEQRSKEATFVADRNQHIVEAIDKRLDALDQSMNRLATTVTFELSEQNRRVAAVEARMGGVENSLNNLRVELEGKIEAANARTLTVMGLMIAISTLLFSGITFLFTRIPAPSG